MKRSMIIMSGILLAATLTTVTVSDEKKGEPSPEEMAKMMEAMQKARKFTAPSEMHNALKKFLGEWKSETRFYMGDKPSPPEIGEVSNKWLIEGRFIMSEAKGMMMGQPFKGYTMMGYDNFKMSYVAASMTTWDTALRMSEGDIDPRTNALIMYGTVDEYLTGEHDKMSKLVFRFDGDDKYTWEIHDLSIGEKNTKVIEVTHTRK